MHGSACTMPQILHRVLYCSFSTQIWVPAMTLDLLVFIFIMCFNKKVWLALCSGYWLVSGGNFFSSYYLCLTHKHRSCIVTNLTDKKAALYHCGIVKVARDALEFCQIMFTTFGLPRFFMLAAQCRSAKERRRTCAYTCISRGGMG